MRETKIYCDHCGKELNEMHDYPEQEIGFYACNLGRKERYIMLEKRTVSQCISSDYCKGWNDAIDEMPKWIDVKDRLPEKADWYLVYAESQRPFVAYFKGKTFPLNNHYHKITHWMPLPEPPKACVENG